MDIKSSKTSAFSKDKMTEMERLELASKLDKELDTFISGLEKRKSHEAWPEDKWEEEMEKHPFFMTKPPAEGEPLPPLLHGLQQLKYDDSENTPEQMASTYKDDGNFNFQHKNYRMGIISYTEGIKRKCSDINLNAQLYNNRAACHFKLKNFRSSLSDCCTALKLKPDYEKALVKKVQCLLELERFTECKQECEAFTKQYPASSESVTDILKKADSALVTEKIKKRQQKINELHTTLIMNRVLDAVKKRGIKFIDQCNTETLESAVLNARVTLDAENRLSWPVALLYPEYKTSDLIEQFHEDSTFVEQLTEIFAERPSWDSDARYTVENVNVYYEGESGDIHPVKTDSTLGCVICESDFRVDKGTPVFLIFSKNSQVEKSFLKHCNSE